MEISIYKLRSVIDKLEDAELAYRKQINIYKAIYHNYHSIYENGSDKQMLKKNLDKLQEGYLCIKRFRESLTDIVKCYGSAEKNIINGASERFVNSLDLKPIDIESARQILESYNIKII